MSDSHALTLRLDPALYAKLAIIAQAQGVPVSAVIREACANHADAELPAAWIRVYDQHAAINPTQGAPT